MRVATRQFNCGQLALVPLCVLNPQRNRAIDPLTGPSVSIPSAISFFLSYLVIAVGIDTDGPGWGSMALFLGGPRTHSGTSASCPQLNWRVATRNSNLIILEINKLVQIQMLTFSSMYAMLT